MRYLRAHWRWALMLLAVLAPRLWQLNRFITVDEIIYLDHARQFLQGLASGDYSLTLGVGYPAVTSAWVNALALLVLFGFSRQGLVTTSASVSSLSQFLAGADVQPLPYYVAGRVASAVFFTALLLVFYVLARRLLASTGLSGEDVALLGALLLSLDAYVVGYSRQMHIDVPMALLMLLAAMAWLLRLKEGRKRWLGLTGLFSGLAILTKTTALLLLPILAGISLLIELVKDRDSLRMWPVDKAWLARTLGAWLAALGIAVLVFCAFWPAMWQDPGAAFGLTASKLWAEQEPGYGNWGRFWMGRFVQSPGPAFYLVALLLKLSPLMLVGLTFSLGSLRRARERQAEWGLWGYAFLFLLAVAVPGKKSVRYMLPAFVAFAPLAACGLLRLGRKLTGVLSAWLKGKGYDDASGERLAQISLRLGFVLLLLVFSLPYAPYYLSYYNPLLLGWRWAPEAILVGWGEGLDEAARYLNQHPGAAQARVAAWYERTFAPYFVGQTLPLSTENAMGADYTVFYINQVQRNIPDPNLITYFQRRRPEHVVRLNGIDYAWIYPAISRDGQAPASAIPVGVPMGESVVLEGYEARPAATGQGLIVSLYWRVLRSDLPDYFVYVRAVDGEGQIHARADSPPVMGFWPTSRWEVGKLVADEQVLLRPPETMPGTYRLEVGMYDPQTWAVLEPASGERGEGGGLLLGEVSLP